MLEKKDLEMIGEIVDKRARQTENILLDEMARTQRYLENKIQVVQEEVKVISTYYMNSKLDNSTLDLLQKADMEMSERIDKLEEKTA